MILPLKVLLCLFGLFYAFEGVSNVFYWSSRESRRLFQLGRLLRAVFGFVLIVISVAGEA
jgi:hypothetical protein